MRRSRPAPAVAAAAVLVAVAAGTGAPAAAETTPSPPHGAQGRFDRVWHTFMPSSTTLRDAAPATVGLDPVPLEEMVRELRSYEAPAAGRSRPLYAGAVVLVAHDGAVVTSDASGWALRYADGAGTELPRDQWVPVREDTIFDMASVSKLFTSIVVMQQVEAGRIDLDKPVASYLPEFAAGGKDAVTVRQLLTHTSGLPAWLPLWRDWPTPQARIHAALRAEPVAGPGERYLYSDLNMITAGVLAEHVSGKPLDVLVRDGITRPLGMVDTGYNPPASKLDRIAATEYQSSPARGMVRGEVHDENAWALGGVAGHAGVFSTARDMARLAQAVLDGGAYAGHRILSRESVEAMLTDENQRFPGDAHGLGFELDQRWYMDGLSGPRTAGHTGYTGTSLVIDPQSRSFVILLSNRVHPSRSWGSNNPARRAAARGLALSLGVRPRHGSTAWLASDGPSRTSTLTLPLQLSPDAPARASFDLFVDSEQTDRLHLEASRDGGGTWEPVPFSVRDRGESDLGGDPGADGTIGGETGRQWLSARADLSGLTGALTLRWRYTTDALYSGRGVYVDGIRVTSGDDVVADTERDPALVHADGFTAVSR